MTDRTLRAAELDLRCAPLIRAVRSAGSVPSAEIDALIPGDHSDVDAWLLCYAQLRIWIAAPQAYGPGDDDAKADAIVTAALREVPIPVPGVDGVVVYPKSFETMLQLAVLNAQLDRLVAGLITAIGDDATLLDVDGGVQRATAVSYCTQLMAWAWTHPGPGLPFAATDAEPVVPAHVIAWEPTALLAITQAAHEFSASLAACQTLIDPVPSRDGGRRPSWAGFFEAVGAQTHLDPRELAVTQSFAKVLAMAYLGMDRQRVRESGDDA